MVLALSILIFCLSMGFTYGVLKYTLHKQLLDIPNHRSAHSRAVPRGGGIAIVLSYLIGLIVWFLLFQIPVPVFVALVGSTLIVAGVGLWDDFGRISQKWRLFAHFGASLWAIVFLGLSPQMDYSHLIPLISSPFFQALSVILFSWLINLFNFMDGIDGLASSECVFVGLVGAYLNDLTSLHSLPFLFLAAAAAGFLIWNWPPAKIFMGDVASGFIGLAIGVLGLYTSLITPHVPIEIWLLLPAVFITDATYTLLVRMGKGEKWYQAHNSHAYQKAARNWGHKKVTLGVQLINWIWLLPLSLILVQNPQFRGPLLLLGYTPLVLLAILLKAGSPDKPPSL